MQGGSLVMSAANQQMFINFRWVSADSGATMPVFEPSTGESLTEITCAGAGEVDRAVRAVRYAFEEGAWGRLPPVERGRLLGRLAQRIADHDKELATIKARNSGKPMSQTRADITAASGYFVAVLKEPYGVTGHILPWNYPSQMFGHTLAPALAVGNAVVLKPDEKACLTILRLIKLAAEVGFPEGPLNVVTGRSDEAGAALARYPGLGFLSITDSPEVGTLVLKAAAHNHIDCTLEVGGSRHRSCSPTPISIRHCRSS